MRPQIVPDSSNLVDLELEPEGWFDGAQNDIDAWVAEYGEQDDNESD